MLKGPSSIMLKGPSSRTLCIRRRCSMQQTNGLCPTALRSGSQANYKEKPQRLRAAGVKVLLWFPVREPHLQLCAGLKRQVALVEAEVELVGTLCRLHRQTEAA